MSATAFDTNLLLRYDHYVTVGTHQVSTEGVKIGESGKGLR